METNQVLGIQKCVQNTECPLGKLFLVCTKSSAHYHNEAHEGAAHVYQLVNVYLQFETMTFPGSHSGHMHSRARADPHPD